MPFLALAAAVSALNAAPAPPLVVTVKPSPPPVCKADPLVVASSPGALGARRLGDLPEGRLIHAVMRSQGGCDYMDVRVRGPAGPNDWRWARVATGAPARIAPEPAAPGR